MTELGVVQLALALVPIGLAVVLYGRFVSDWHSIGWASLRMLIQLLLIGYALTAIFDVQHSVLVLLILLVMSIGAGWIAARSIQKYNQPRSPVYWAVCIAAVSHLFWIILVVIRPTPWFNPAVVIPLAGMIFANTMNVVSLCAERFWSEREQNIALADAIKNAMSAAMIPQINALLAVGLVSLPGMMTGQILSGVSPLIAVRYQIVVMAMVLSTGALGASLYLAWQRYSAQRASNG